MLVTTDPAPNAVRPSVPEAVTLIFSEPVTPAGVGVKVYAPSGRQVAAPAMARGSVLVADLASSETGTYVVSWQVFAADTHPSRGAFAFSVGHETANPYGFLLGAAQVGTSSPLGAALQVLAHWLHFAGFALVAGAVAYGLLVRPAASYLVRAGVVMLIAAEPLVLLAQLASLSFDGDTILAVLGSSFGRLLGLRLAAAIGLWTLLPTGRRWPLLAVAGVIAVLDGFSSHGIPPLVSVHVAAMGLWVGGLAAFAQSPDRRFARVALVTFGIAAATGLLLAYAHTHLGTALLATAYGRVLIVKVLVVGAALGVALWGRRRIELAAVAAVIALAALVATLPPPF